MLPLNEGDDDRPIGRVLSRREVLALLGSGAGATLLAACLPQALSSGSAIPSASASALGSAAGSGGTNVPSCVIVPELTEGPYYVDGPWSDRTSGPIRPGQRRATVCRWRSPSRSPA